MGLGTGANFRDSAGVKESGKNRKGNKILHSGQADPSSIYIWMHEDNELMIVAHSLSEMIDRYFNEEI